MDAKSFDWKSLQKDFQSATGFDAWPRGDEAWWERWHAHVAERESPRWFYSSEDATLWFKKQWHALAAKWVQTGEQQLSDLTHAGEFRPVRRPNGDIDWGANPTRSMSWAGFHYWSRANPLIRAYALTGDERFPRAFAAHLKSYFEQVDTFTPELWDGPDPTSRDWRDWITFNDLSAGIKMVTFAEAVMVFRRSTAWGPSDLRRATLLLFRLARRVFERYEKASDAEISDQKNFLTSAASGLGATAVIFPVYPRSAQWEHWHDTSLKSILWTSTTRTGGTRSCARSTTRQECATYFFSSNCWL